MANHILVLNAGSSTVKFALFSDNGALNNIVSGMVEGIGGKLRLEIDGDGTPAHFERVNANSDHGGAVAQILAFLDQRFEHLTIRAVGHRIVHGGMDFTAPALLDDDTIKALEKLGPFAPLHQKHNLAGVAAARGAFPQAVQYGCFDTSFHRTHPWVADAYGLPMKFYQDGVRRYGFHGLSYEFIASELTSLAPEIADERVIVAHLGNGASLCALKAGCSMASTMGFSPLDGLLMGTRCGQVDPGVLLYLMDQRGMNADDITRLLYYDSGLKGLSGVSSDMRQLLASDKPEAAKAVDYFIFHARREIAAMASTIEGLDAFVFTGGIGENARSIRARICDGLGWLGFELDQTKNESNEPVISTPESRVKILVVPTNEELTIARKAELFL